MQQGAQPRYRRRAARTARALRAWLRHPGTLGRYALAVAVALGAVALRLVLLSGLGVSAPYLHSYPVIIAVGWWLGFGPGVAVTLVTTVSSVLLILAPLVWDMDGRADSLALVAYLVVGTLLALMASRFRDTRRAAELATQQARRQAEHNARLVRVRDGFASMLAHELRTPLTVILGDAVLLARRRSELSPETAELVDDISAETARLRVLVEDLLVLNRDDGDLDLALEPMSVRQVIAGVIDGGRGDQLPAGLEVVVAPDLPLVQGDPVYLGQVLRNLLSNARKYGAPPFRLTAGGGSGVVDIMVSDGGPGIPPGTEDRIFDLFVRGHERPVGSPGAGVGLYVCRRLMRAMGGTIRAQARPGGGVVFHLQLSAALAEE